MQKMEVNPFVVTGHISPEYFCDRREESARIIKLIRNSNNIVLKSDRRMGKTGLIQYCFDQAVINENYYTFFIDILHTSCLQELTHEIGRSVYNQTIPHGKRLVQKLLRTLQSISGKFGFDANTGMPTFSIGLGDIEKPEYTLEEIFNYLEHADRPCIVAIDEFQQIAKYPEKNIEALLRSHIQKSSNCHFIFAGSEKHLLGMMFDNRNRPFYKSADNMHLDAIPRDIYVSFICQQFRNRNRSIQESVTEQVYDMFEGHTYYVQKTMNEAFSNTLDGDECGWNIILKSLNFILDDNGNFYREQLSRLPLRQKTVLYAIAADGKASRITSADFIKRHKLSSASSVQAAIKKLREEELVVEEEKTYRLSDRFFGLWIKRMMTI